MARRPLAARLACRARHLLGLPVDLEAGHLEGVGLGGLPTRVGEVISPHPRRADHLDAEALAALDHLAGRDIGGVGEVPLGQYSATHLD